MAKLTETKFKKLHDNIDTQLRIDIEALKAKAEHEHNALNTVWNMLQDTPLPSISPSKNGDAGETGDRKAHPTRKWIVNIIDGLPDTAEISQPQIFDALSELHTEIRERSDRSVKGQIAAVLKRLVDSEVLVIKTLAHGQDPTIYTKHVTADSAQQQLDM